MAKKAKKRLEEDEVYASFKFPDFDERKFIHHEFEQSWAIAIAFGFAVVLAAVCYSLDRMGLPLVVPALLGVLLLISSPFIVQRLRPLAHEYTKGDWAGILMTVFFGWLGFWFLFLDIFRF